MISRRNFLVGSCCALHAMINSGAHAQSDATSNFICATVDPKDTLSIVEYSSQSEKLEIEDSIKNFNITPYGTMFFGHRWRKTDGITPGSGKITLGVYFLDGTSNQKDLVRQYASVWSQRLGDYVAFDFTVAQASSQLRVGFDTSDGNWSYVGRNNLTISNKRKTLNLTNVTPGIVQHEFGHALGLQHEHQFPGHGLRWNKDKVIADMAAQGWSPAMTEANIFAKLSVNAACVGNPELDYRSCMFYPIMPGWAEIQKVVGGPWVPFVTSGGQTISDGDVKCLKGVYALKA